MTEPLNPERRAPVWEALSELFVGRELQDYDYAAVAETLRRSRYSLDELDKMRHAEVAPVFRSNLSPLAVPEMEGRARDAIVNDIQAYLMRERTALSRLLMRLTAPKALPKLVSDRWQRIRPLVS